MVPGGQTLHAGEHTPFPDTCPRTPSRLRSPMFTLLLLACLVAAGVLSHGLVSVLLMTGVALGGATDQSG